MPQDKKRILIEDLCGRLPYGVKVRYSSYNKFITCTLHSINPAYNNIDLWSKDACFNSVGIDKIKPYLFPLLSMTEEQQIDLTKYLNARVVFVNSEISFQCLYANTMDKWKKVFEWCIKNHFDIYGLIPMGLAIDATDLGIYP